MQEQEERERISGSSIQSETPRGSRQITEGAAAKCVRCGASFERPKPVGGLFRPFLADHCPECRTVVEAEWKKGEAERIAAARERAAADRIERQRRTRTRDLGGELAYDEFKFETYDPDLNGTHDWFNHAKRFQLEAKNLFVYGPTGVGKTHLGVAIVRGMYERNGTVRVYTADELVVKLFGITGRANPYDQQEAVNELASIDALFIDELDKLEARERYVNAVQRVVDARDRRRKFGLVMAANVDLIRVAQMFGMPLADRLDGKTFEVWRIPENTPSVRGIIKRKCV
jgi:DNA replication protein DnaC